MNQRCRLTHCLGLGAAASPNALVCDPASGRYALADAVNVDVVEGRLVRRPGVTRVGDVGFETLFSDGPNLYGVCGDGLYLVPGEGSPGLLRAGLTRGAPMAFVAVGGAVYFANGHETGRICDGVAAPWRGERYPGPDRTGRFGPPPAGHLLAFFAGRIWIAKESLVHMTQGAGLLDWVDGLGGFLPPCVGRVRFLAPVSDGLFIGDAAGVTFAAGTDPNTMTFARVCPVAPLPGSLAALSAGQHAVVAGRELGGDAALWAGGDGLYLGLSGGRVSRVATIKLPPASTGTAVVTHNRYQLFLNA